jgi:C-terminal processing protease CtpA/Prc
MRNHSVNVSTTKSENPVLSMLNCARIFPQAGTIKVPTRAMSLPPTNAWFLFKKLDDSTNYLYIGTFNGSLRSKFDSAYQAIMPELTQRPRLIIDIRSNGGGSDACWQELARLLYTDPIPLDSWEYYASPEIIKRYEEQLVEMEKRKQEYGEGAIDHYQSIVKRLKKAKPGTFVPAGGSGLYTQKKIQTLPAQVIVMFNRQSASAAEGLILKAIYSKKVLTFGENSGGYIAYGNIMSVTTPSGFRLNSATHRVLNRTRYEKVGIAPTVRANNEEDWIEQARKLWGKIER